MEAEFLFCPLSPLSITHSCLRIQAIFLSLQAPQISKRSFLRLCSPPFFCYKPHRFLVLFASLAEPLCPFVIHLGDFQEEDPQQLGWCMQRHEVFPIGFETYALFSLCCFIGNFNRKKKNVSRFDPVLPLLLLFTK